MLFGFINDSVKYVYIDKKTKKVILSFKTLQQRNIYFESFSKETLDLISNELEFKELKIHWYENNFELAKLVLPFVIIFYIFFRVL